MNKLISKLALTALFVINTSNIFAQCAMCKAAVESNVSSSSQHVGKGLNTGILFLMSIPYILLALLLWYFFGGKIKTFFNQFKNIYPNVN
jgi:ABC-type dipeptide/oligopeptide/nickel transport system permease component